MPDDIIPDEDESTAPSAAAGLALVPRLWPFFRKYLGWVVLAGIALLASAVAGLLGPVLIKHAIDVDIARRSLAGLARTAVFYLLLEVGSAAATYLQSILLARAGQYAVADLKVKLFGHIVKLPASFFDSNPVGRLITRTEGDAESLHQLFSSTAVSLARNAILLVGMAVVMAVVNWRLFLLVFALLPVLGLLLYLLQKRTGAIYVAIRRTVAELNNVIAETLRSVSVVQAFSREDYFTARIDRLSERQFRQEAKARTLWAYIWFLLDSGETIGLALVLGLGGIWALKGLITVGGLVLFYSYITRLFGPLRALSNQANVVQRAFAAGTRVFGIFDTPVEPAGSPDCRFSGLKDKVEFDSVGFAYQGREQVLKGVSLELARGEKVALVGETGGGKTSIASLLLKLYEPQTGRILVDGANLAQLDTCSLRRTIGFVPQDVVLFPGSVLDNLRLFDDSIAEARVHDAARRARLHDRILRLPDGYSTNLAERGINLSLGERQLLAFTRALVTNPDVLVLDEATSSVDPETEAEIQRGLEELLKGRTAVVIAHRLATIRMVDRIIVVHQGEIVQEGKHDELVACDGMYRRLYELQYLNQGA